MIATVFFSVFFISIIIGILVVFFFIAKMIYTFQAEIDACIIKNQDH